MLGVSVSVRLCVTTSVIDSVTDCVTVCVIDSVTDGATVAVGAIVSVTETVCVIEGVIETVCACDRLWLSDWLCDKLNDKLFAVLSDWLSDVCLETSWLKYVDIETLSDKDTALLIDCWVDVLIEIDCDLLASKDTD